MPQRKTKITIRLPEDLLHDLDELAEKRLSSRNAIIAGLVLRAVMVERAFSGASDFIASGAEAVNAR